MGKDYKDPEQMKEVVDWAVKNLGPNVLKYTTDQATPQQLFESGAIDAVGVLEQPRPARVPRWPHGGGAARAPDDLSRPTATCGSRRAPQHPVLAQIFMNWRLAKDVQFPNAWPIDHGQWSELSEGFLGPDYVDQVPDWFKADYYTYFPTLDQIQIGVQDDRLGGLQRQLEDLPGLLRPDSLASKPR